MSSPTDAGGRLRIGNSERAEAISALDAHLEAGRLDAEEYGERVGRVSVARTQDDLTPLFADLPAPGPGTTVRTTARTTGAPRPAAPYVPAAPGHRQALGGRVGEALVASSSILAVIAFFVLLQFTGMAWLVFLAVPLISTVVCGDRKAHKAHRRGGCSRR